MPEREQPHLRIRLDAGLLKRIDAAAERSGRTRTNEIERRLLESFLKNDIQAVAEMAVHNVLVRVHELEESLAKAKGREPTDLPGIVEAAIGKSASAKRLSSKRKWHSYKGTKR